MPNLNADLSVLLYRDTPTGALLVCARDAPFTRSVGRCFVSLRYVDASPGDTDGVLAYDASTFRRLVAVGILEEVPYHILYAA